LSGFPETGRSGCHEPTGVQPGAAKNKREAFEELFRAGVKGSYHETIRDWRGYLLLAVDASHIALPQDAALRRPAPQWHTILRTTS
jgi:hypothetical protein